MANKFGNTVRLEILDSDRRVIFDTRGLRVDFHVKILNGFNRAKFSIYNLNESTIRSISSGNRFVRLYVSLHGGAVQTLNYDLFVNNSMTIKRLPDGVTELFCIDAAKKDFLDVQIKLLVNSPTLENYINAMLREVKYKGKIITKYFPPAILKYKPVRPVGIWTGSPEGLLRKLGKSYGFNVYVKGNVIELHYKPLKGNQKESGQNDEIPYILDTVHMRSNPKIGVAKLEIESLLDFAIDSGVMLDTSQLLTAETSLGFKDLTVSNNYLKASVDGNSRFQTLTVEHIGSNFTSDWTTKAMAVKATKGTHTPTYGWYG